MTSFKRSISETQALIDLEKIREEFRNNVAAYERNARPCKTCEMPGACCVDAHFVNVRISRLEAVAIGHALSDLPPVRQLAVAERIENSIEQFGLDLDDDVSRTYACPLYERSVGCLVHDTAKPLPCINHACYSSERDLPPDDLLDKAELAVDRLNRSVYKKPQPLLSLPVAIRKVSGK